MNFHQSGFPSKHSGVVNYCLCHLFLTSFSCYPLLEVHEARLYIPKIGLLFTSHNCLFSGGFQSLPKSITLLHLVFFIIPSWSVLCREYIPIFPARNIFSGRYILQNLQRNHVITLKMVTHSGNPYFHKNVQTFNL